MARSTDVADKATASTEEASESEKVASAAVDDWILLRDVIRPGRPRTPLV